jgi:glycosyltransferase involved in cell wall biosynthesis
MAKIVVNLLSFTGTKGGMEHYTRRLYEELGALGTGHEFVGYASKEFMTRDHSWFPGEVINSKISGENRWSWAFGELFMVARFARRMNADLIHNPATLGPWRSRVPAVYTMHDMLYHRAPELMATPFYTKPVQWMEARLAANATFVMADSLETKKDIQTFVKIPAERIDVVYLAGTLRESAVATQERERDLFLVVGNRLPHKNMAGIIRAIARIPEPERPRLVVTGSRGDDPLRQIVDELSLEKWVQLREWVSNEELDWLYGHATALVNASVCDGFGLPSLDAMHVGLPVLLSDIDVYREINGNAAGYFDPHDLDSIASTLLRAVREPQWTTELAERGYEHVKQYSWRATAEQSLDVFERALTDPRRAKSIPRGELHSQSHPVERER